jgi:uncharacterized membrane protein
MTYLKVHYFEGDVQCVGTTLLLLLLLQFSLIIIIFIIIIIIIIIVVVAYKRAQQKYQDEYKDIKKVLFKLFEKGGWDGLDIQIEF